MKKLILILLSLSLLLTCENEPLDPDFTEQGQGDNDGNDDDNEDEDEDNGGESDDLSLSVYELDSKVNLVFFGIPIETVNNSDANISNNKIVSSTNAISINGSPFEIENQTITRNGSGQIVSDISINSEGVTTNETLIAYTNGVVSQISYDFYIDEDDEDYIYNFTYDGNTITRTEVDSNISTVFGLDNFGRVISKQSFDGTFSIQTEFITYSEDGNITSSIATGESASNNTYLFDNNTNPLKVVFDDNYLLTFLNDDYSDEIGNQIAQFMSINNWTGATFNGETFNFDVEYNTAGRIINRDIVYNFGTELNIEMNEKFNYVN